MNYLSILFSMIIIINSLWSSNEDYYNELFIYSIFNDYYNQFFMKLLLISYINVFKNNQKVIFKYFSVIYSYPFFMKIIIMNSLSILFSMIIIINSLWSSNEDYYNKDCY